MKDKKTYNMDLQTGEKTSHKAVSQSILVCVYSGSCIRNSDDVCWYF